MTIARMKRLSKIYHPAIYSRFFRMIGQPVFRGLFLLFSKIKVIGRENIPRRGPYMVVFNHVSLYDPPVVVAFWPTQLEVLGAIEVWSRKGQGILARLWGGIPIRRSVLHREAIDQTIAVLRSDLPLLLSPEGGRSHVPGLRKAKTGIVYIAEATQAPIIPVGVTGTTDDFLQKLLQGKRPEVQMNIGKPFTLPQSLEDRELIPREVRQRKADYIMSKIADLLPVTYHGYYGNLQTNKINVT